MNMTNMTEMLYFYSTSKKSADLRWFIDCTIFLAVHLFLSAWKHIDHGLLPAHINIKPLQVSVEQGGNIKPY